MRPGGVRRRRSRPAARTRSRPAHRHRAGEGPLGGIVTALDHFAQVTDHVAIVSCDMPFLTAADLAPLVTRAAVAGVDVVVGRSSRATTVRGLGDPCGRPGAGLVRTRDTIGPRHARRTRHRGRPGVDGGRPQHQHAGRSPSVAWQRVVRRDHRRGACCARSAGARRRRPRSRRVGRRPHSVGGARAVGDRARPARRSTARRRTSSARSGDAAHTPASSPPTASSRWSTCSVG